MIYCIGYTLVAIHFPLLFVAAVFFVSMNERFVNAEVILRRIKAVCFVTVFSLISTYYLLSRAVENPGEKMGFHFYGTLSAIVIPLFLTAIAYSGTLYTCYLGGYHLNLIDKHYWIKCFRRVEWIREVVASPVLEELTFRACSASMISLCVPESVVIYVWPLIFSCSHLHHVYFDFKHGHDIIDTLMDRIFQVAFTYFFGVYATYIYIQTGHIISPIVVHAFCNALGVPEFHKINRFPVKTQKVLWLLHATGLLIWAFTLKMFLSPQLYTFI